MIPWKTFFICSDILMNDLKNDDDGGMIFKLFHIPTGFWSHSK